MTPKKTENHPQIFQSRLDNQLNMRLNTYLGRLVRDIRRKCESPQGRLLELLEMSERLLAQKKNSKHKLYRYHATETVRIAKGKAHKNMSLAAMLGW